MNSIGPGTRPHMTIPPKSRAVVGDPGMPSVSIGKSDPVDAALFAVSGDATPSMFPLPKVSGFLDMSLDNPYDISAAGVAPAAGNIPTKKPRNEPKLNVRHSLFISFMPSQMSRSVRRAGVTVGADVDVSAQA